MDRSQDWMHALEQSCRQLQLPEAKITALKSALLLRTRPQPSPFMKAVTAVSKSIHELDQFISLHQDAYRTTGIYSDRDKDEIEAEISAMVKACTGGIDQLQKSVTQAALGHTTQSIQQGQQGSDRQGGVGTPVRLINEQTAAFRHGVVLNLAEQLAAVTARFDVCRAARYQQILRDSQSPAPSLHTRTHTDSKAAAAGVGYKPGAVGAAAAALAQSAATALAGKTGAAAVDNVAKLAATALSGKTGNAAVDNVAKLGGAMLTRVKGVKDAVIGGTGAGMGGWEGDHGARTPHAAHTPKASPQLTQQQQMLAMENRALVEELSAKATAVHGIERSIREIATLNQLFATAVQHQAAQIESIYEQAVEASLNIKRGNVEVKKTIAVNKSTHKYMVAILITAILGLLFFDWFNS